MMNIIETFADTNCEIAAIKILYSILVVPKTRQEYENRKEKLSNSTSRRSGKKSASASKNVLGDENSTEDVISPSLTRKKKKLDESEILPRKLSEDSFVLFINVSLIRHNNNLLMKIAHHK